MKTHRAVIVAGLGFGDEGKGTVVDALARRRRSSTVVRYNGGAQAGHNVVTADGRWHCFAQFGAGSLVRTSNTFLSRHMLLDLKALEAEAEALALKGVRSPLSRLTVDPDCLVVTPYQKFVGQMREMARGAKANGSCGMGVGETVVDGEEGLSVRVRDLLSSAAVAKLRRLMDVKLAQMGALALDVDPAETKRMLGWLGDKASAEQMASQYRAILRDSGLRVDDGHALRRSLTERDAVIFEGAQGALLDRRRGFVPHVTKSDTTAANAVRLIREVFVHPPYKLGILRAYGHRHGNGPFPTEDESLRERFDDANNRHNRWQGVFRVGWLDLPALRYAIAMNGGVDGLAVTGLDRLSGLETVNVCVEYRDENAAQSLRSLGNVTTSGALLRGRVASCRPTYQALPGWKEDINLVSRFEDLPKNAQAFIRFLESDEGLGRPVAVVSVGPTAKHKLFLRKP